LDMDCTRFTLPNKLRVLVVPMPANESATVTVWVRTGSRFEDKKTNGLSHFLEHMAFKGSPKYPTTKDVAGAIDAIGGVFNAGTSKEWTNFYVKVRVGVIETAFDVLSDMIIRPLLKEEEIEREKGVIVQEIHLYKDNPTMRISDIFENVIFKGSSLSWNIAGSTQTVKGIKRKDFISYRAKHYFSENMMVVVAGGVTADKVRTLARKYFSDIKPKGIRSKKPQDVIKQTKPQVLLESKKTDQAHFILGFRTSSLENEGRYAQALLAAVLGGGMSSRLIIEIRERRGLAYAVQTALEQVMDNGYIGTYVGVRTEKIDEAIKIMLTQMYGIATRELPISKEELAKAKEYIKGHIALSLEDSTAVNEFFALKELLLNKTQTPEEVYKKIDAVKVEGIYQVAKKYFKPERLNLAVVGPFKDAAKFEKLLSFKRE